MKNNVDVSFQELPITGSGRHVYICPMVAVTHLSSIVQGNSGKKLDTGTPATKA